MNLRKAILAEHSKRQTQKIVRWVGDDKKRFAELLKLFMGSEYLVTQRAGWPLSYCVEEHPDLAKPHLKKLLHNLKKEGLHDAVKRNTVRLLQDIEIPEKFQGLTVEICFGYLHSATEAIAVKVFSMTVLGNICKKYPELAKELKMLIEAQLPYSSAAFKSRAKQTLMQLRLA